MKHSSQLKAGSETEQDPQALLAENGDPKLEAGKSGEKRAR